MEGVSCCTTLYNPMTHGAHALLYNPMTHGDLYPLYNVVWPHDPWGFFTIAAPMTHGEKVAEGAPRNGGKFRQGGKGVNSGGSDQELPSHMIQESGATMTKETEAGTPQKAEVSMGQEIGEG